MNEGNIAGKSNPGGRGTNVGIWTGRKKRIYAEVALRKCPQGKLRALSSLRRVEEEKGDPSAADWAGAQVRVTQEGGASSAPTRQRVDAIG